MPHQIPLFCALFGDVEKADFEPGIGLQRTHAGVTQLVVDIVCDVSRIANTKQALNQMFNGSGKATGKYKHLGLPIWHASSGNGQKSVCLFYTMNGGTAQLVAIGAHNSGNSYSIEWGRLNGDFKSGSTIRLS